MTPNKTNIDLVFRGLKAEFTNAYQAAETTWERIAMSVSSMTATEEYPWLTRFPQMRQWVDERVIKQLTAHIYQLRNEDWEATIAVDRNDMEDDRLGMYSTQARGAGESARLWADERVYDAIDNSFTAVCHDGQPFFADAHPLSDGGPAFDNKIDNALQSETVALAAGSFGKAETMIMEMTDPEGRPLGLMPELLVVPPALKAPATVMMMADRLDDKPNPYKESAQVVVSSRLTSRTAWFLIARGPAGLRPFIWQLRKQPEIAMLTDPDNPHVFMKRELLFGIHGRGVAGYTLPQLAVGSTGTTSG